MINRYLENEIGILLKHFPVIGILGARQVGKTTLAKSLSANIDKPTIFLDLENPNDFNILDENPMLFFEANKDKCVVIDEIQRSPRLFTIIRSSVDNNRVPARFILLGSASPELLALSSETLAGRIVYKELTPLNLLEIADVKDESYKTHWLKGGFPEPFLMKEDFVRKEWYKSFVQTYIEREFAVLGLETDYLKLGQFFSMLAYLQGNIVNVANLSKSLDINVPTINKYISYFEKAFIVRVLKPYTINSKKRLIKSPKIYIRDSGLLHYLWNANDLNTLFVNPNLGFSWEGYAMEQIVSLAKDYQPYYYRTQDQTECDLVLCNNIQPEISIEFKISDAPKSTKSFTNSINDLKTEKNFIVIPECKEPYSLNYNVKVCDLEYLLKLILENKKK